MITKHQITEEEFKVFLKAVEKTLGYAGFWGKKDIIECCTSSKHCTSMCVDTFESSLRNQFIIKD
jgi:hypothetical protein